MRHGSRALVELAGWLAQHVEKHFKLVSASHEFGHPGRRDQLQTLDGRKLDPTFVDSDDYDLRLFPSVATVRPRALLPLDADIVESELHYTFAIWTQRQPYDSAMSPFANSPLESNVQRMWTEILPDMHSLGTPTGVARKRLALLAAEFEKLIPDRSFLHLATVGSARHPPVDYGHDLVSVFVALDSLERVAKLMD
jgi:hypothetical protein